MPIDQWELALAACYRQAGSGPLEPETVLRVLGDIYLPLLRTPQFLSPRAPNVCHHDDALLARIEHIRVSLLDFTGGISPTQLADVVYIPSSPGAWLTLHC